MNRFQKFPVMYTQFDNQYKCGYTTDEVGRFTFLFLPNITTVKQTTQVNINYWYNNYMHPTIK